MYSIFHSEHVSYDIRSVATINRHIKCFDHGSAMLVGLQAILTDLVFSCLVFSLSYYERNSVRMRLKCGIFILFYEQG